MSEVDLLDGLVTEAEAATGIKKVPRTLQRWRRLGIGPVTTFVGNRPMYAIDDIKTWLRAQRKVPQIKRRRRST